MPKSHMSKRQIRDAGVGRMLHRRPATHLLGAEKVLPPTLIPKLQI